MSALNVTVKTAATIQTIIPPNTASSSPDSITHEITSQARIEDHTYQIAALGTTSITLASEGLTTADLLKIQGLTAGKPFTLKFNGDPTGVTCNAPSATGVPFYLATSNFATLIIGNPDAAVPIFVSVSMFQKTP
jgi:hypothetical protein